MVPNPHDALVKVVFGKPEHAQGMLRTVVPAAVAASLEWATLTLCPGSFVDLALKEQHTDLLYSARWRDGGELLVYFLFEHLRAPPKKDSLLAFRLLRYQVRIWEDWHARHQDAKTLPMICLKHARTSTDFIKILVRWMDVVREVARAPNGLKALAQVLCYILEVNDHVEREALQALLERDIGPEAKDAIVTAGQQLIEQGRREGRREGECAMLLRQLRRRFGNAVDTKIEQRIATASIEQIDTWGERVLSAATLADLLAD